MLGFIPQKRSAVLLSQAPSGPQIVSAADLGEKHLFMTSDVPDPRVSLLAGLDVHACRVEFSDAPIVLLCGGLVRDEPEPASGYKSLRHAISRSLTNFEVFRPEEITSWHADGVFHDLMSFERELASICSLVVIILESEGALVELGAFSQLSEMSAKIVAIRSNQYASHESFINLGILRFISEKNGSSVKSYPWDIKNATSISEEVIQDVASDIREELSKQSKSQLFRIDQNSHVITMICELVRLFVALKEQEIFEYLGLLGISTTRDILRGQLFLLIEFKIIKKQLYSDALFYIRSDVIYHKLRIATKNKSESTDTLRIDIQCREYYQANAEKHRNRIRAIALASKGPTNE